MVLGPQAGLASGRGHRDLTNGERAARLFAEAQDIARELREALSRARWNLATRRAQEIVELTLKALLNQMGVEVPKTHDPAPLVVQTINDRRLGLDAATLAWLPAFSARLAALRGPAFYQETDVTESGAREAAAGAERVLAFGHAALARLRPQ